MDYTLNYYAILGIINTSNEKEIKKAYYRLSFTHHPDKGGDKDEFDKITKAYDILMDNKLKNDYDKRSKWGNNYDESSELLNYEFTNESDFWHKSDINKFKKDNVLNIIIEIEDDSIENLTYERWVICKTCKGTGKDTNSKIQIKDKNGNILKIFDGEDGCDFCEGTGKDWKGNLCSFCYGNGKSGSSECLTCNGEKRILGNQKISGIDIKNKTEMKYDFMGHFSKTEPGKCGHLWLIKKK